MVTNATPAELRQALDKINKKYDGNISFCTLEHKTKSRVSFTLAAKSKLKGARRSHSGRNLPKASWHVHGDLFDALFEIREDIFILSLGARITKDEGNWVDRQVGSPMQPVFMSELSIL